MSMMDTSFVQSLGLLQVLLYDNIIMLTLPFPLYFSVEVLYKAMSECQKLHPDPEDEDSEGKVYLGNGRM